MGVILAAIALTLLIGDRVGVTVDRVTPVGSARSTSAITIQFSETMNRESVQDRLTFDPPLAGDSRWNGNTLIYAPLEAMQPGALYTAALQSGARSEGGRLVLNQYEFSFEVRRPRVAYLYPADDTPQNIWVVDPANPDSAAQVTFSPTGIYDFAVSPNGSQIAFAERNTNGTNDLKLLDIETGGLIQLTNCRDSSCTTPVWRPDGGLIAYERVDYNSSLSDVGRSPTRIWVVDPTVSPPTTRPLFDETQILGYNAQWSADGTRIALFDSASISILIYDLTTDAIISIPSRAGTSGALSPDGLRLVFAETTSVEDGSGFRTYLRIADLPANDPGSGSVDFISRPEDELKDDQARWSPDGSRLAVARQYLDARYTRGYQLVIIDPATPDNARMLSADPAYADGVFSWSPNGDELVVQRLRLVDENGQPDNLARPEIWVVGADTTDSARVATNGYLPRWVP